MTTRAVASGFAGEGEEFLVTAVRAMEAGESLGEIPATIELLDDFDGFGTEWSMTFPVGSFVLGLEIIPPMVDDLPKR